MHGALAVAVSELGEPSAEILRRQTKRDLEAPEQLKTSYPR